MKHSNNVVIKCIDDPKVWDDYVQLDPRSDFCHLFNWSRVIKEVYHHKPIYLAALENRQDKQTVHGIFPIFQFKALMRKPRLVSIPFFDNAGILGRNHAIDSKLLQEGVTLLKNGLCTALEIRQDVPSVFSDSAIFENLYSKVSTLKVDLRLKLGLTSGKMMQTFKSKLRSQIKKGLKNGLKAQVGKEELIEPFYEVFSRNMRDLGSPVHSLKFFKAIFTHFKQHVFICIVNYRARPVAAGFMFRFKSEIKTPGLHP